MLTRTLSITDVRRGFTLVEILVVVVILAILAAIVVPQFTSAAGQSRENATKQTLHRMRQQIEVYRGHHGRYPPSAATLAEQLASTTNAAGDIAAAGTTGYPYGPYIREMPVNPQTGGNSVGDTPIASGGTADWCYDATTGGLHANDSAEAFAY